MLRARVLLLLGAILSGLVFAGQGMGPGPGLGASAPGDPSFSSVVALVLNNNGTNASTSFLDQSNSAHAMSSQSSAAWTNSAPPTGLSTSLAVNGAASPVQEVTATDSADFSMGAGAFTAEAWVSTTNNTHSGNFLVMGCGGSTDLQFQLQMAADSHIYVFLSSNGTTWDVSQGDLWSGITIANNTWYHIAVTRSGNTFRVFANGNLVSGNPSLVSAATLHSITTTACAGNRSFQIGSASGGDTQNFAGTIAAVRVTKGVARWTSNFTPPTLPLPTH